MLEEQRERLKLRGPGGEWGDGAGEEKAEQGHVESWSSHEKTTFIPRPVGEPLTGVKQLTGDQLWAPRR